MRQTHLLVAGWCLAVMVGARAQTEDEVQQAIDVAKAAYQKADSVQGAWVNTPKQIEKAEQAAAQGNEPEALKYAKEAKKEADLGYAQAIHEKEHWSPPPYLR